MSTTEPEQLEAVSVLDETAPPAGEEIHLPGGSILPLTVALGITMMVVGTTIWLVWSLVGFIIFLVSVGMWIRDTRHEVDSLPEDHHHH